MFRFAKTAIAAGALGSLVLSQPALAVRSSESLPVPGAKVSGQFGRVGTPVHKSEDIAGVPVIGLLIGLAVVIGAVVVIADDSNHDKSPG